MAIRRTGERKAGEEVNGRKGNRGEEMGREETPDRTEEGEEREE